MVSRDRVLVIVLALVVANLTFWLGSIISYIWQHPTNAFSWALAIADVVAIIGTFYLMRTYLRGRKIAKKKLEDAQSKEDK